MTVRVLVVDDSPSMRRLITAVLSMDDDIEVVGAAGDPHEARAAIKALNPDVLTLDVEMPNMNGLEFLEKIMRLRPMPVVMVSTLTHAGTETALAALELGAVDVVGKPDGARPGPEGFEGLAAKVKAAASARLLRVGAAATGVPREPRPAQSAGAYTPDPDHILAIGASTGGVEALIEVVSGLPKTCPPTVIVQHMPPRFTASFAARLDRASEATVTEAADGDPLLPGRVYIAPGGDFHLEVTPGSTPRCRLLAGDPVSGHRPSVDVLFHSVARLRRPATGVILTGMGRDGAEGLLAMRRAGARTIGQDEASCVIYGMPKAAFEIGAVERQAPLSRMAATILSACSTNHRAA
ncbi:MAG: chemotaxis response regulator protein-glutamate methylesterase [Alphaproteobacteria bacterium]|nr:chemotaxis response regulator protein-glutamate methylesterase [Alphaproteobacteria bacterium]